MDSTRCPSNAIGICVSQADKLRTERPDDSQDRQGRPRRWRKESGYHRQGTVGNAFFRYKTMLGDRLHARGLAAQHTEVALGCKVLNRMLSCGRPKSVAVAV